MYKQKPTVGYNYHVEVGAYFNSSCQVPHNSIAVVASGEQHSGIEGVWLQHKHLVLVALRTDRSYNEPKISYQDTESNLYNTPYVPRYFKEHTHTVLSRKKKTGKHFYIKHLVKICMVTVHMNFYSFYFLSNI